MPVRLDDLDLDNLLDAPPGGGVLRFAGGRTLLLDAVAMGILRKQLVDLLGEHAARGVFTRFGYSHGWRTSDAMEQALEWASRDEWRRAGGRLHRLQGLVRFEPEPDPPEDVFASAVWTDSYEVEQHLLHCGPSDEPVCWSLAGFASGYLSRSHGERIYAVETECVGRGDRRCRMVAPARRGLGRRTRAARRALRAAVSRRVAARSACRPGGCRARSGSPA